MLCLVGYNSVADNTGLSSSFV